MYGFFCFVLRLCCYCSVCTNAVGCTACESVVVCGGGGVCLRWCVCMFVLCVVAHEQV